MTSEHAEESMCLAMHWFHRTDARQNERVPFVRCSARSIGSTMPASQCRDYQERQLASTDRDKDNQQSV